MQTVTFATLLRKLQFVIRVTIVPTKSSAAGNGAMSLRNYSSSLIKYSLADFMEMGFFWWTYTFHMKAV